MSRSPFTIAEKYITLHKKFQPDTWSETANLISDMIVVPLITLFFFFVGGVSHMSMVMTLAKTYQVWSSFFEYTDVRFAVQRMKMKMYSMGGPFIVTNNPIYMPYVYADAIVRHSEGIRG